METKTRTEMLENFWEEFLIHCKTLNTISQIENDKFIESHPEQADLAPPYQTVWVNEQNFWMWYMDEKMPKIKVKKAETKK